MVHLSIGKINVNTLRINSLLISFFSKLKWRDGIFSAYDYVKSFFITPLLGKEHELSSCEKLVLQHQIPFYQKLSKEQQMLFEKRLAIFLDIYTFIGRKGYVITSETKVCIGSVYIMMTLGMREYLTKVFDKIIVYPCEFFSKAHQRNHKGEFNFSCRALVFSWKDFIAGFSIEDDNVNLGVHEFMHALSFHGKVSKDYSAHLFDAMYNDILAYVMKPAIVHKIRLENYFRAYAFTNSYEFMAVMMENFFESPIEFKKRFPRLFAKVVRMLNYKAVLNLQS